MTGHTDGGTSGGRANAIRALTAAAALVVLAGCSGGSSLGSLLPSGAKSAVASGGAAASPADPAPFARATPAGRSAQGAAMPQASPQAETPEQINADCWMAAEGQKKLHSLDERLKFVDKCVDERTKGK